MILTYFRAILEFERGIDNLKRTLRTCKNSKDRRIIATHINTFEAIISDYKVITDAHLAGYNGNKMDKDIIIEHFYNKKSWTNAIITVVGNHVDFNTDSYRRTIEEKLRHTY